MTCSASPLEPRTGADGSFSFYSGAFGEGFHSATGAWSEARHTYVEPAELERFPPGRQLSVLDVGLGLGYNSAALLEAAAARGLTLRWWGLELDPRPLGLALRSPAFRRQWQAGTLAFLEQLSRKGPWRGAAGTGTVLWGDARQQLATVERQAGGGCDLVLLDAFSPRRCPELWSQEFLGRLGGLLAPGGRLLTYSSAAAVRRSLLEAGLEIAAIRPARPAAGLWSGGTAASPDPLPARGRLGPLSAMECEHLATRAAEPYRDPTGRADSSEILARRAQAQARSTAASTSDWRRRWGAIRPAGSAAGKHT